MTTGREWQGLCRGTRVKQGSGPQVLHVVPARADDWSPGPGTAGGSEEVAAVAPARVPTVPLGPQQLL